MTLDELAELIGRRQEYLSAMQEREKMSALYSVTLYFTGHNSLEVRGDSVDKIREQLVDSANARIARAKIALSELGVETPE
jgi:hypothetical protein